MFFAPFRARRHPDSFVTLSEAKDLPRTAWVRGDVCFLREETSVCALSAMPIAPPWKSGPSRAAFGNGARTRALAPVVVFLCGSGNDSRGAKAHNPQKDD